MALLEHGDNGAAHLMAAIALALDEIEPVGRDIFAALRAGGADDLEPVSPAWVRRSRAAARRSCSSWTTPTAGVDGARNVLRVLGSHAAGLAARVASRIEPPLPVGRMRAHRHVIELGPRDLVMTRAEAGSC